MDKLLLIVIQTSAFFRCDFPSVPAENFAGVYPPAEARSPWGQTKRWTSTLSSVREKLRLFHSTFLSLICWRLSVYRNDHSTTSLRSVESIQLASVFSPMSVSQFSLLQSWNLILNWLQPVSTSITTEHRSPLNCNSLPPTRSTCDTLQPLTYSFTGNTESCNKHSETVVTKHFLLQWRFLSTSTGVAETIDQTPSSRWTSVQDE